MRIAFFAPVQHRDRPDGREAFRLAQALAESCELTVYVRPDPLRPPPDVGGLRIEPQERFESHYGARAYDHVLYFLADDAFTCGYVAGALDTEERNVPGGVVLLRDGSMQHHFQTGTLYLGNARAFEEGMAHSHGELGERAGPVVAYGGGHEMMFRQHDVLRSYLESSSLIVAPTREMARRAKRQRGQLEPFVRVVPRGIVPAEASVAEWSRWLGSDAASGRRHVIRVGDLPLDRRDAMAVARAILERYPDGHVVLLGSGPRQGDLVHPRATWLDAALPDEGPLPDVHGVIDLREPTPGRVVVEVLRWMSAGMPVWVSDHPAFEDLPGGMPGRIRVDRDPVQQILAAFEDATVRDVARDAAGAVRRSHSVHGEARGILRLLNEHGRALADRRVLLGRLWKGLLAEKRRRLNRLLRDDVFRGLPTDLEGFGPDFVAEVEAELGVMGLGDWNDEAGQVSGSG